MRARWRACDAKRVSRSSTFSSLAQRRARGRFRDFREENVMPVANGRRVAVIAGCRTPFCKSGTALKDARAVDMARFVARELLERTNLDGTEVNAVIFGQVVPSALVPNVAREVSLLPQFPKEIPAYSLNRACASSGQAVSNASDQITLGNANVVMAGGVESLSDIPILASRRLADILVEASRARTLPARLRTFTRIRPRDLVPVSPAIAEPSTGESMGQSAEKMAKENHITRAAGARAPGSTPLAYIRAYAVAAVDPGWQLLQAPIFAVPKALERAGIEWRDLGLVEVHEAFAAQVLSNFQGWAAKGWEVNEEVINVMGGSIAIGHPFGATGGRVVTTRGNEMARRDVQFGLLSICAQGGMGFAMVLERR